MKLTKAQARLIDRLFEPEPYVKNLKGFSWTGTILPMCESDFVFDWKGNGTRVAFMRVK